MSSNSNPPTSDPNPAPSSGAGGSPPPSDPEPLTSKEVVAWLSLQGLTPEQINQEPLRGHVMSLEGCIGDRQLKKTLNWMKTEGVQGFDPAIVTIESLRQDLSAAAQRYAADPPPPEPPKKSFFGWLLGLIEAGIFWILRALAALAGGLWRALGHIAHGLGSIGRVLGRRWQPIAVVLVGVGVFLLLLFVGNKGFEWWKNRPTEVAETTSPPAQTAPPAPTVVAQPAPTPAPPPATGEVLQPPTGQQPYPPNAVTPGATRPAIYRPALDIQCTNLWRLVDCTLPRGCTTSYANAPPRLRVTCEDGKTWTDSKVMAGYPQNKRVSVHLIRSPSP